MGSDTDEATGKPRRSPHRNARKQVLVWTLACGLLLAVGVYLFADETSVGELRNRTQDLVSRRVASRVVQSVESVTRAAGAVSGGTDLARAEAVYRRNVKRREAAYGPQLDGQYLGAQLRILTSQTERQLWIFKRHFPKRTFTTFFWIFHVYPAFTSTLCELERSRSTIRGGSLRTFKSLSFWKALQSFPYFCK